MHKSVLDWLDITPPKPPRPTKILIQEIGSSKRYVARWIEDDITSGWWIDDLDRYATRIVAWWPIGT